MTVAMRAGDGGTDPSRDPVASAELVVTVVVPETTEAIGSGSSAARGSSTTRISDVIPYEWGGVESCQERIQEECRGVWERWVAALMERVSYLSWTCGGFGPAEITCREGKKPSGERFCRCVVYLRCWAEYEVRRDFLGSQGIRPALAAEEWLNYAPLDRTLAQHAPAVAHDNAHGAAALALHGQPYGFTWDDYYALLDNAHEIEHDHGGDFMPPERRQQVDTLRWIAALLPPREGQG